jgi:hypothetical protein
MAHDTIALSNWKNKWDERVSALLMKSNGANWDDIEWLDLLAKKEKRKILRKSWYTERNRTFKEVRITYSLVLQPLILHRIRSRKLPTRLRRTKCLK